MEGCGHRMEVVSKFERQLPVELWWCDGAVQAHRFAPETCNGCSSIAQIFCWCGPSLVMAGQWRSCGALVDLLPVLQHMPVIAGGCCGRRGV